MRKTGVADLPLHGGHVPPWLFIRMKKLARAIVKVIIVEWGRHELLRRLSDPYWFQALGCALGYDWHSSGVTTVVTAALREAVDPHEHGVAVCGGKGKKGLLTPKEVAKAGEMFGLSDSRIAELQRASKLAAKVDSAAIQDGFSIYHHAMIVTEDGAWAIIQQGMRPLEKVARRYHWLGEHVRRFDEEPHTAIVSEVIYGEVLNLVARDSREARRCIADLVREPPSKVARLLAEVSGYLTLDRWLGPAIESDKHRALKYLKMPWRVDWRALERAYQLQPSNFEEVLEVRGLGAATLRGLALVADLIYGEEPSWKDPAKYSFAFGGKDGVPYPVNAESMDKAIETLEEAIRLAEAGYREKLEALKRLRLLLYEKRV